MNDLDPWEVQSGETVAFVQRVWKEFGTVARPLRLLDVGAGEGRAGRALADAGFEVRCIEPNPEAAVKARARGLDVVESDITAWSPGPEKCEIVLFGRSLHHVPAIDRALEVACAALAPGGLVVLEEFAYDAADEPTAAWIEERFHQGVHAGELERPEDDHGHEPRKGATPLERWQGRFDHDPPLHKGAVLLAALERIVGKPLLVETPPYLYRWIESHSVRIRPREIRGVLAEERAAIGRQAVKPVGLRAVSAARPAFG